MMDKRKNLQKLEELFNQPEVTGGFSSQQDCISWANKAAPLLRFNNDYYRVFMYNSQIINRNVSIYTAIPAFRTMVSQVEMAIEQLKHEIENEKKQTAQTDNKNETDILDLKPNLYGIGINLNEGWRRVKKWFKKNR